MELTHWSRSPLTEFNEATYCGGKPRKACGYGLQEARKYLANVTSYVKPHNIGSLVGPEGREFSATAYRNVTSVALFPLCLITDLWGCVSSMRFPRGIRKPITANGLPWRTRLTASIQNNSLRQSLANHGGSYG